jgi:molecular chaperone GrpE
MSEIEFNKKDEQEKSQTETNATDLQQEQTDTTEKKSSDDKMSEGSDAVTAESAVDYKKKFEELNDSHLRLMAEFDNYRKRTLREKSELIKNGGEAALTHLLPIIDDFERALETIRKAEDMKAVIDGVELIYNKFVAYLSQQGVEAIEAVGKPFATDMFDAVAMIPAPDPKMKGKVLDCIQTGYKLHDKVLRHAKVVVGE